MVPSRTGGVTPDETLMIYSSQEPGTERGVCGRRQGVPALSSEGWGGGCPHVHVPTRIHTHRRTDTRPPPPGPHVLGWHSLSPRHPPARARVLASVILPSAAQERTAGGSGMGDHEVGVGEQENFLLPETPCDCAQPTRPHRRKAAAAGPAAPGPAGTRTPRWDGRDSWASLPLLSRA